MNQREAIGESSSVKKPGRIHRISSLAPALAGLLTTVLIYILAPQLSSSGR